ncbi:MAG: ATP-binding protein [Dokdonella sp.]|uniref:ATP-binding protein n=1 Tax=Dokdonella sp. TaxID=2291710 RepID=UPI003263E6F6
MHLRLWHRLFLAFAALSVLALAGFAAWQQHAFRSGFMGYLEDVSIERLQPATTRLSDAYLENGGWQFLRDDPRRFGDLIELRDARRRDRARDDPPSPPDDRRDPRVDDRGPDIFRGPRRGPPPGPPDLMHRLALLDATGIQVAGNPTVAAASDVRDLAIELDGQTIGTLRLERMPQIRDALDLGFAQAQTRSALLAGLAVLVGAFLLAFALARWLLAPVRELADGTRALAAGDYAHRIPTARSDELGVLAADFNHLATSLEKHRDARRQWGADIAHELRTPLSVLRGEVQALQDGVRAPTPRAFDSLNTECERLGSLIEDLYQLALADAGALEYRFESVDLSELVQDAIDLQRAACMDARLAIEEQIATVAPVRGDVRRLAQLFDNLIANARRYTDTPGRIRIELATDVGGARVIIEDTPPGVPPADLAHLFDRLFRVDASRSRAAGGAGLGLAICRAIVDAHGGSIGVEPSPLGGLRVVVRVPFAAAGPT